SLRIQQVLAYETDLLEYPDIFEGSKVMDGLVDELLEGARAELDVVQERGGAVEAVAYMKAALVDSHRERVRRIEAGEQTVVGINRYTETEDSPLTADAEGGILVVDRAVEAGQIADVERWRTARDDAAVHEALAALARTAQDEHENIMPATIAAARAGATTGEWALTPREIATSALQEGVHVVGLSILSGSHRELIPLVVEELHEAGVDAPVVVGGIIPEADVAGLRDAGVAAVYTPKDFDLSKIMRDIVELVAERHGLTAAA